MSYRKRKEDCNKVSETSKAHEIASAVSFFIKHNAVLCVAAILAVITCFIIPPNGEYLGYFDFKTLSCLFCTLGVVGALRNISFFSILARAIVKKTGTLRMAVFSIVFITFFGSMLIANDMALLTFLPLGYYVLTAADKKHLMAYTFILQNIAANLGGMLTPFGNPQNLYLYTKFSIPNGEFMEIMLLPFAAATIIIAVCCLFVSNEKIALSDETEKKLNPKRTVFYLVLFAISIIMVFRIIPYWVGLIVIFAALMITDRIAVLHVDYGLLSTFVCMFVFAGNMARIDFIREFLSSLLEKNALIFSALSCQFISNVPSAVLLSQFTENYAPLLRGVNIGGTGTLIASLASLITFREYTRFNAHSAGKYIAMFSAMNFGFLAVLLILCSVFPV